MRKLIALTLFLGLLNSITCMGQVYVDGFAIDTVNTPYCQLICANGSILTRATIVIDYGQRYVDTGWGRQKIAGPDRQPIVFNSSIDALNFMIRNGWTLVSSQVTSTESGSDGKFIYLLQRRKRGQGPE